MSINAYILVLVLVDLCKLSRVITGEEREAQRVLCRQDKVPEDCDGLLFLFIKLINKYIGASGLPRKQHASPKQTKRRRPNLSAIKANCCRSFGSESSQSILHDQRRSNTCTYIHVGTIIPNRYYVVAPSSGWRAINKSGSAFDVPCFAPLASWRGRVATLQDLSPITDC